ncbi:uncharacterized protein [Oryza sativa Japonica Group]|nr:A disintegrin and metalloproteinase with thrombospondin motifs 7 [Oryza sativa Japonica Group]KAF2951137.1 hypothetical protein DAI22_01g239700 [Oryza sativa Japonica Group]
MAAALPRLCALALPFLAVAACLDVPSHGCYWTGCQSKWSRVCSAGHFLDSQSDDCDGLCTESKSPPCLPFHKHFHCCITGTPKLTNKCGHCKNKLDFGKEFVCCSDCSDPTILIKHRKMGYCKSGAELSMQLKPHEIYHWVAGPWMKCSSPCDGGVRYRDVACYGNLSDATIKHYPVDDASCSADEMPARQEACNEQSCGVDMAEQTNSRKNGMSGWLVALILLLGLGAIGGIVFTSYTYYLRRTSGRNGFVYVMMEAYS